MENSRRKFLQKISMATAVIPFTNMETVSKIENNIKYEGKKLRVALCGLGAYATNNLLPGLQKSQMCELAGIVTGTPAKKEAWKAKHNLPEKNCYNYENFDSIKDNPDIDAVYIVLPNSMHKEYSIRAAKAGKQVICEKPMAMNVKEAKEMIAACKAAGVTLSIGYRLHYEPFTQEVMRLAKDKDFGKVKFVDGKFAWRNRDLKAWRMNGSLSGGGAFMDVGIYCINASRYATGEEPISVTAQQIKTEPDIYRDIEETYQWQLKFPSGAVANGSSSYAFNAHKLAVHYEKGFLEMQPAYDYGPLKGETSKGPMNLPITHHQTLMLDGMADSILNNKPILTPGEEGLKDQIIMEAIVKAVKTGKEIKIMYS
jgi:predicted dehydrogenase